MLASGSVPVTVFRAGMVIGAGSASFEILRYLVERLPVMVTPKWVTTESQPIAVGNVLAYLVDCLRVPETVGRTLDIGGPDVVSYQTLMRIMAEERGLPRRLVIPVPVLTPRLSSLWIHLVTPLSHRIARPLAEGLRNRVVCRNDDAARLMPQRLLGVREAIRLALASGRTARGGDGVVGRRAHRGRPRLGGRHRVRRSAADRGVGEPSDGLSRGDSTGWSQRLVRSRLALAAPGRLSTALSAGPGSGADGGSRSARIRRGPGLLAGRPPSRRSPAGAAGRDEAAR